MKEKVGEGMKKRKKINILKKRKENKQRRRGTAGLKIVYSAYVGIMVFYE